jgi:uncharacterized protein (DUF2132 family)
VSHQNLKDPLHGVTLETILTRLVEHVGWKDLAKRIPVRCFLFEPTITSSLRFFRKTPWARKKVEDLYVRVFKKRFCSHVPKPAFPPKGEDRGISISPSAG